MPGIDVMKIHGYRRADGQFGIRNHVLVLGINGLAVRAAERIAANILGAILVATHAGRGQIEPDLSFHLNELAGLAKNPNVAAVLIVGVDQMSADTIAASVATTGKPYDVVTFAETEEDMLTVLDLGIRRAARLALLASGSSREEAPLSDLIVGIEDGEIRLEIGELGMAAQDTGADRVEGAEPGHTLHALADEVADALLHLARRLVGEGHGEDFPAIGAAGRKDMGDAGGEDARLAGAGAGQHQERPIRRQHRVPLLGIETVEIARRAPAELAGDRAGRRQVAPLWLSSHRPAANLGLFSYCLYRRGPAQSICGRADCPQAMRRGTVPSLPDMNKVKLGGGRFRKRC